MKYYAYYPGCSSEATAAGLGHSAMAITKTLDMELIELEDWNCCGSTPYGSLDGVESLAVVVRNLALGEKTGLDLVTPCNSCFVTLSNAQLRLKAHRELMNQVNEALAIANLEYHGNVKIRLLTEVLINDITPQTIASKVKHPLNGLKIAPYYGCQEARPSFGFDDPEFPQALDDLVTSLGADAVPYPLKNHCCGGALSISEEDLALELMHRLLSNAMKSGAQCIATACPLCQTNLDAYQSRVNSKFRTSYHIPILFITQLMGVAFGLSKDELGLKTNIVPTERVLARYI